MQSSMEGKDHIVSDASSASVPSPDETEDTISAATFLAERGILDNNTATAPCRAVAATMRKRKRVQLAAQHDIVTYVDDMTEEERGNFWWRQEEFDDTKAVVKQMCRGLRSKRRFSNSLSDAYQIACTRSTMHSEEELGLQNIHAETSNSSSVTADVLASGDNCEISGFDSASPAKERECSAKALQSSPVSSLSFDLAVLGAKSMEAALSLTYALSSLRDSLICLKIAAPEGWNDFHRLIMLFEGSAICSRSSMLCLWNKHDKENQKSETQRHWQDIRNAHLGTLALLLHGWGWEMHWPQDKQLSKKKRARRSLDHLLSRRSNRDC